jgi:hypothetical protein
MTPVDEVSACPAEGSPQKRLRHYHRDKTEKGEGRNHHSPLLGRLVPLRGFEPRFPD